jgi:hypothetical protein
MGINLQLIWQFLRKKIANIAKNPPIQGVFAIKVAF